MPANNDITGDKIRSKTVTEEYREGWTRIFRNDSQDGSGGVTTEALNEVVEDGEEPITEEK